MVPKALRDELGLQAGQPLNARVCDGRLEIEPLPLDTRLVDVDGLLVIEAVEPQSPLGRESVRSAVESVRR